MHAPIRQSRVPSLLRLLSTAALLLLGLVAVPSAHAQGQRDPQAMLQQRIELYTTRLKLDAAQAEQVKAILTKQSEDQRALMQQANGDFASIREKMQPLREEANKKIEAVLKSDEQKAAFKALQEEEAARRRQRMGGGQ